MGGVGGRPAVRLVVFLVGKGSSACGCRSVCHSAVVGSVLVYLCGTQWLPSWKRAVGKTFRRDIVGREGRNGSCDADCVVGAAVGLFLCRGNMAFHPSHACRMDGGSGGFGNVVAVDNLQAVEPGGGPVCVLHS